MKLRRLLAAVAPSFILIFGLSSTIWCQSSHAPQRMAIEPSIAAVYANTGEFPTADPVYAVAFSPDSSMLAAATANRVLRWDVATGQPQTPLMGFRGTAKLLAWSPDSKVIAGAGNGLDPSIRLYSAQTALPITTIKEAAPATAITFSSDGKLLAIALPTRVIELRNAETGTLKGSLVGATYAATDLLFADGDKILLAVGGGLGRQLGRLPSATSPRKPSVDIWRWSTIGEFARWDVLNGHSLQTELIPEGGPNARISPDGTLVAFVGSNALTKGAGDPTGRDPNDMERLVSWENDKLQVWHVPAPGEAPASTQYLQGAIVCEAPLGRNHPAWSADSRLVCASGNFGVVDISHNSLVRAGTYSGKSTFVCATISDSGEFAAAGTAEITIDPLFPAHNRVGVWTALTTAGPLL